mmetsp:Transcript_14391/g.16087  ORF Transcript_14391/g.16087 Transcript_14391/m.16087 type:complete len:135 (-) Transcript_14391:176-580(-)
MAYKSEQSVVEQYPLFCRPKKMPDGPAKTTYAALGLGVFVGSWAGCYRFRPAARLFPRLATKLDTAAVKKLGPRAARLREPNRNRLIVSCMESFVLRLVATPILIPGKMSLAYWCVNRWGAETSEEAEADAAPL